MYKTFIFKLQNLIHSNDCTDSIQYFYSSYVFFTFLWFPFWFLSHIKIEQQQYHVKSHQMAVATVTLAYWLHWIWTSQLQTINKTMEEWTRMWHHQHQWHRTLSHWHPLWIDTHWVLNIFYSFYNWIPFKTVKYTSWPLRYVDLVIS